MNKLVAGVLVGVTQLAHVKNVFKVMVRVGATEIAHGIGGNGRALPCKNPNYKILKVRNANFTRFSLRILRQKCSEGIRALIGDEKESINVHGGCTQTKQVNKSMLKSFC